MRNIPHPKPPLTRYSNSISSPIRTIFFTLNKLDLSLSQNLLEIPRSHDQNSPRHLIPLCIHQRPNRSNPTFYRTGISLSAFAFDALSHRSMGNRVLIGSTWTYRFFFFHASSPPPLLSSPTFLPFKESEAEVERKRRRAKNEKWGWPKPRSADERSVRFRSLKSVNNSHVEDNEAISGYAPRPRSSFGRELGTFEYSTDFYVIPLSSYCLFSGTGCVSQGTRESQTRSGFPQSLPALSLSEFNRRSASWFKDLTFFRSCFVVARIRRVTQREKEGENSRENFSLRVNHLAWIVSNIYIFGVALPRWRVNLWYVAFVQIKLHRIILILLFRE